MEPLTAPEGVTCELDDGTRAPCYLAYRGIIDGQHTWDVYSPVAHTVAEPRLHCAMLPAETNLRLNVAYVPETGRWRFVPPPESTEG